MTIKITDRTTGESYYATSVKDCEEWADKVGFRFVEAYGETLVLGNTVYELIGEYHGRNHCSQDTHSGT